MIDSVEMSEEEANDTNAEAASLGPIATRILYEDHHVRVWEQVIERGDSTGPHRHELPYALVTVEGSTLDVHPVRGYPAMHGADVLTVPIESRTAGILPEGAVEDARNIGDETYRAILVEFKQG